MKAVLFPFIARSKRQNETKRRFGFNYGQYMRRERVCQLAAS
jgi:hypothetical protein